MRDSEDLLGRINLLREELQHMVYEVGSLTDSRVLRVSALLDEAILAYIALSERGDAHEGPSSITPSR